MGTFHLVNICQHLLLLISHAEIVGIDNASDDEYDIYKVGEGSGIPWCVDIDFYHLFIRRKSSPLSLYSKGIGIGREV